MFKEAAGILGKNTRQDVDWISALAVNVYCSLSPTDKKSEWHPVVI